MYSCIFLYVSLRKKYSTKNYHKILQSLIIQKLWLKLLYNTCSKMLDFLCLTLSLTFMLDSYAWLFITKLQQFIWISFLYRIYLADRQIYCFYNNLHHNVSVVQLYRKLCKMRRNLNVIFATMFSPCRTGMADNATVVASRELRGFGEGARRE